MSERITRYSTGNLGMTVNGIRILLTVSADQEDAARLLADAIVAIGPEAIPATDQPLTPTEKPEPKRTTKRFVVGQSVWCNVTAIRKWMIVTAVHADGRIKVDGGRSWCPLHNFNESVPDWQKGN